jgi:PPM family protein phosphatase
MNLVAGAETHPGYLRSNNEDAHLIFAEKDLYVVADGMAGHRFGELASAISINTMRRFYSSDELDRLLDAQFRRAKKAKLEPKNHPYEQFKLRRSIEEANLAIFNTARRNPQYETMGTTLVAASFCGKNVYVAHVGDSRAYRLRDGTLTLLTEDHSLLNEYLRMNYIQQDEAETFPMKNVIVRALGLSDFVEVEVHRKTVKPGDLFMMCTDGLSDLVGDDEIEAGMKQIAEGSADENVLVQMALDAGGVDNVTVMIVQVGDDA